MNRIKPVFLLFGLSFNVGAVSFLTDSVLKVWNSTNVDYIAFDVRDMANPVEVAVPTFYCSADEAVASVRLLRQQRRLLITCYSGSLAQYTASRIADDGYPSDSIWYSGFDLLPSHRRSVQDTLSLKLLQANAVLPAVIDGYALRAIMVGSREVKVIDVRTQSETDVGMVPGACRLDWSSGEFQTQAPNCLSTETEVFIYCRSGNRANQARDWLIDNMGFDPARVISLEGYAALWVGKGLPQTPYSSPFCQCLAIEQGNVGFARQGVLALSPSPFNSVLRITFNSSKNEPVELSIVTIDGKRVFYAKMASYGEACSYLWNASGRPCGKYVVSIRSGKFKESAMAVLGR